MSDVNGMSELLDIGDRIVAQARPGEQVEVVVGRSTSTEIRAYRGDVEQFTSATGAGVGVRVVAGGRQGFAYAESLDPEVVAEVLADARDNATFASHDEWLGLAEPDGVPVPQLDLYRESAGAVSASAKIELALDLERAVAAADSRIAAVESADYADGISEGAVVSTTGMRTFSRESSCYVSAHCVATEGDDTQTGFGFSVGRSIEDLDLDRAAGDAARRATRLLGASKPASGRMTVVLDPYVTAQFLAIIGSTLSGEAVLKGRSIFGDRMGEAIAAGGFTLVDDATNPLAYSASETDGEGLASRRNVLIEGGVLRGFVHNAYTARRAGTTSTANAVRGIASTPGVGCRALALQPGIHDQVELLAAVGDGVLISSVSGLHSGVNAVSGDFSAGAEGLRIRDGAMAEPLREFTIASTLQRMISEVGEVGSDIEWLPMRAAGVSLVVGDVTVSGLS
ncbi:MAG: TldD/PmbA family protein [Microthrixaceae bacterium]|jgi:PmbA protein|nr:TldD/PmbA family protein [Microthrixaceae bacterium]